MQALLTQALGASIGAAIEQAVLDASQLSLPAVVMSLQLQVLHLGRAVMAVPVTSGPSASKLAAGMPLPVTVLCAGALKHPAVLGAWQLLRLPAMVVAGSPAGAVAPALLCLCVAQH